MKVKTRIIILSTITIVGSLLAVCWAVDADDPCNQVPEGWPCRGWLLGGSWTQSVAPVPPMTPGDQPAIIYETFSPIDPVGDVLTYKQTYANPDNTMGGILPDADLGGELVGTAVRTGTNTYTFTLIGYAAKSRMADRGEILGIVVSSGTMTLTGPDTRMDSNVFMALYTPDTDINPADGQPDEGTEPLICIGPYINPASRVRIMPPCTPGPMPE